MRLEYRHKLYNDSEDYCILIDETRLKSKRIMEIKISVKAYRINVRL